jgi:hypothetical protein
LHPAEITAERKNFKPRFDKPGARLPGGFLTGEEVLFQERAFEQRFMAGCVPRERAAPPRTPPSRAPMGACFFRKKWNFYACSRV